MATDPGLPTNASTGRILVRSHAPQLLRVMLWSCLLVCVGVGVMSLAASWSRSGPITSLAWFLFLLGGMCAVGLYMLRRGAERAAAALLSIAIFASITFAAYRAEGLRDEAIIAYPAFILCVTFLFERRRTLTLAVASCIVAVALIGYLQMNGQLPLADPSIELFTVGVISILLLATGAFIWIVRESWLRNLHLVVESYDMTLDGWAAALEIRDCETAGHCGRVRELSTELARRIGCDDDEVEAIRRGAYMHDIGKMGVPDAILLKPGPLTPEEREVIERHPAIGRDLLAKIPFFAEAAAVIYSHHERWDGAGYPEGLAREGIPLGARVFAVADHWDALNSDRPYRKAWTREAAVEHMRENSGTIYDPKVADALFQILAEEQGEARQPASFGSGQTRSRSG